VSDRQELADGCLWIHTFRNGNTMQEEHFGAMEFVRGLGSSSMPKLINPNEQRVPGKLSLRAHLFLDYSAHTNSSGLRSMVVDHLATENQHGTTGVACMYLNHKEAEDHTPSKLLSGLWRQLVLGKDIGFVAEKLYQQHHEKHTTPSVGEVFDMLRSTIGGYSRVYIIVDAMDEYPEAQRRILLEYLVVMGPTVNLMITSRPHITPDACLPNISSLEIRANEDDIRRYVEGQIEKSS
jgi:hypothetical protein